MVRGSGGTRVVVHRETAAGSGDGLAEASARAAGQTKSQARRVGSAAKLEDMVLVAS